MQPRFLSPGKANPEKHPVENRESPRPPRKLLSVRSALVLTLAVLAALGGAGLLYLAHRPVALVVLGAIGILAAALKLFDSTIELGSLPGS
jgi:hypothetical protein